MKNKAKECALFFVLVNLLTILLCYLFAKRGDSALSIGAIPFFITLCPTVSAILVENGFDFKKIFKNKFNIAYLIFFPMSIICLVIKSEKMEPIFQLILLIGQLAGLYLLTLKDKKLVGNISLKNTVKWSLLLLLLLSIDIAAVSMYIKGYVDFYNIFMNNVHVLISFVPIMFNMFFAIGEEYGWRQFLQIRLQGMMGKVGGVLLTGVIWGIFHIPLHILYNGEALAYDLASIVSYCIFMGVFLGLCYMKTKSIILTSMLHLLNNAFMDLPDNMFRVLPENFLFSNFYLFSIVVSLVIFMPFLLSKEYRNGDAISD